MNRLKKILGVLVLCLPIVGLFTYIYIDSGHSLETVVKVFVIEFCVIGFVVLCSAIGVILIND